MINPDALKLVPTPMTELFKKSVGEKTNRWGKPHPY
jgi:hypothetical protein